MSVKLLSFFIQGRKVTRFYDFNIHRFVRGKIWRLTLAVNLKTYSEKTGAKVLKGFALLHEYYGLDSYAFSVDPEKLKDIKEDLKEKMVEMLEFFIDYRWFEMIGWVKVDFGEELREVYGEEANDVLERGMLEKWEVLLTDEMGFIQLYDNGDLDEL
jgi:hypothetical protein